MRKSMKDASGWSLIVRRSESDAGHLEPEILGRLDQIPKSKAKRIPSLNYHGNANTEIFQLPYHVIGNTIAKVQEDAELAFADGVQDGGEDDEVQDGGEEDEQEEGEKVIDRQRFQQSHVTLGPTTLRMGRWTTRTQWCYPTSN